MRKVDEVGVLHRKRQLVLSLVYKNFTDKAAPAKPTVPKAICIL